MAGCSIEALAEHERRASWSRRCFWNCKGLIAATARTWWLKPETLIPSSRDILDAQRLVEVFSELLDGLGDVVGGITQGRDVMKPAALCSHQEPVDDLPFQQRREKAPVRL